MHLQQLASAAMCMLHDMETMEQAQGSLAQVLHSTIYPVLVLKGHHLVSKHSLALVHPEAQQVALR